MMNCTVRRLLPFFAALAVFTSPSMTQGRSQGNPHQQKGKHRIEQEDRDRDEDRDDNDTRPIFRKRDRDIIIVYFRAHRSGLPPGLAKRNGDLPPGLEKHLERNGTLPPGLQKRVQSLPPDLEVRLPRLPPIYRRGTIGPDVVILNRKTGAIVDIMRGVITLAGR
jgi:hypothetical protein